MSSLPSNKSQAPVKTLDDLAELADYSFLDNLTPDPAAVASGEDYRPRQVFSGHYVTVKPTPIKAPRYIAHSKKLFEELGFTDELAHTDGFRQLFSGDMSQLPETMRRVGWATGYALSIYGTEYIQQCPFQTGNGYGDGRAISVLEGVFNGQRMEMQLKGAGRTPYCRGADGRAVLRSSVREFLAQEHMHALGIATSRSLSLFVSYAETVERPWYLEGSDSQDPEILVDNPVAISTRVAPSFLRVGQLELFGRRARSQQHPDAMQELEQIVQHLIAREYQEEIDTSQPLSEQILQLAVAFRGRLTTLVANWIRVGYCQGNFNSDNCAGGGFTLDYGPFGFCELFDPAYQPWTGGGRHFSFLNQPAAAEKNFAMFCRAVMPLLAQTPDKLPALDEIQSGFSDLMESKMQAMWAAKLGLEHYHADLTMQLLQLMAHSYVDYTMLFRELSALPTDATALSKAFYTPLSEKLQTQWQQWLDSWQLKIAETGDSQTIAENMKKVNPKYTWREWLVVPAYQQAELGNYELIEELQAILNNPYDEQSPEAEARYYQLRPVALFNVGGVSHYSCSS
ncbi:protein adenylyltransferase SelO [Planctobacterium marinum]|uniref:protein adenylyltransferase SelO n=1 Tax=Planctobacterium marinum TaxID=1631968 RepID=UPI001E497124|nr:protein adenylyltransferase SelO family protein [Planctobacterium marinum]MCC2606764.1 protein adenylyltransferase SelO family protein [Planctobacterium marinum]